MQADGRVDMTKPKFALCNFAKEPKTQFITSQKLIWQSVSYAAHGQEYMSYKLLPRYAIGEIA